MKHMVNYTLKPDCVAENERLIAAVFEALQEAGTAGLRYASLRRDDGVSFVHLVSHDFAEGANPLVALPQFKAFAAGIRERCVEPPVSVELTEIGSHGFFDR